ncbi:MAG: DNA double-strand break repair nuclease NurA [Candidatus Nezhaarchaeales archaeon]|uniref:DNA double-strand break repair nuclease NurA n=1 Tax=Thermofilum sp. TaxID=1961369 RepID=UPI003169D923
MEDNPLLSLPRPIVEALFKCAENEAQTIKARIARLSSKVNELKKVFNFKELSPKRPGIVVAVDGSMSSSPSRRLGSEFSIYTAGYIAFKDLQVIDEKYHAGSLSWSEGFKTFKVLLRLLMAYAERLAALEALKNVNPDYVILDGPFFYFKYYAKAVRHVRIGVEGFDSGRDLIRAVTEATLKLIESRKAVCIIRRSAMRAIDGWLLYNHGVDACIGTRDKHVMAMILPPRSLWSYSSIMGNRHPVHYAIFYAEYVKLRGLGKSLDELESSKEELIDDIEERWRESFRSNLDLSEPPKLNRYYIRYSATAPPFEVEAPPDLDVVDFASQMLSFHNPATGLPMPSDLIDAVVSLPRGSTTIFTEEIEAKLVKDPSIIDKTLISDYFSYLNPQKREYV